jgi:hypothetical protein
VQDGRERIIQYWKSVLGELNVEAPVGMTRKYLSRYSEIPVACKSIGSEGIVATVNRAGKRRLVVFAVGIVFGCGDHALYS